MSHIVCRKFKSIVPAGEKMTSIANAVLPNLPSGTEIDVPITVACGDGIGPEIMEATLRVLEAAGARIAPSTIEIGEAVYLRGITSGIEPAAWDLLRRTKVFLKSPITTPSGGGYKSLNVTIRKSLGLYANVRPCVAYSPYVQTRHPNMDVVIIRENEEDLYAGIEHQQTDDVMQCLKLITRPGCEKIVRYAFEYAVRAGRRKVTCFTKDNIMKLTDGLFHRVFDEIAAEYPNVQSEHMIVDIGAARLVDTPDRFDVIVLPNLYGDSLSDGAAQMSGSIGLAGSANFGDQGAMFEAIHGSAPDLPRNVANPSGLLNAAVLMLEHIGQGDRAAVVHSAWLKTLEDGIHTQDISCESTKIRVGTREFADAVIERLGERPDYLDNSRGAASPAASTIEVKLKPKIIKKKELLGTDVFVHMDGIKPDELAALLRRAETTNLKLQMITNRGVKVWPNGLPETFCTDHWRCRFISDHPTTDGEVVCLLFALGNVGIDFIKLENLYLFDGVPGFALGQGQ